MSFHRRPAIFLSALLLVVGTASSCGRDTSPPPPAATAPTGASAPAGASDPTKDPDYAGYRFDAPDSFVDFGIQPLLLPEAVLTTLMERDGILRDQLAAVGLTPRFHRFKKGADMNAFFDRGDLEATVTGDMQTLIPLGKGKIRPLALCRVSFSSIVAPKIVPIDDLKGKRIGVTQGSSAHYFLQMALSSAGLSEKDVTIVPLLLFEFSDALSDGRIDAFSAREPAPFIALAANRSNEMIFRGRDYSFINISAEFAAKHPKAVGPIAASIVRATTWLRKDPQNQLRACGWAISGWEAMSKKKSPMTAEQVALLTRSDLLDASSSVPAIPVETTAENGTVHKEFLFLQGMNKIPAGADWAGAAKAFDFDTVPRVISDPARHRLNESRYDER